MAEGSKIRIGFYLQRPFPPLQRLPGKLEKEQMLEQADAEQENQLSYTQGAGNQRQGRRGLLTLMKSRHSTRLLDRKKEMPLGDPDRKTPAQGHV